MRQKYFYLIFISTVILLAGTYAPAVTETITYATDLKILIYTGNNAAHTDAMGFYVNYTNAGNIVNISDNYNFAGLEIDEIDVVLFPGNQNFNEEDLNALSSWFNSGVKLLWVGGDSDYGGYFHANQINPVLEAVGTKLRLDAGEIEDPVSNDGAPFRVITNVTGSPSPLVDYVTDGFNRTIFHSPTSVIWFDGIEYRDLRGKTNMAGIDIVLESHTTSNALDQDISTGPDDFYAYSEEKGSYPLLVTEAIGVSLVVVSGEANFMDYKQMYGTTTLYEGTPHQGSLIVDNILSYYYLLKNDQFIVTPDGFLTQTTPFVFGLIAITII